ITCLQPITNPYFGITDSDGGTGAPSRVTQTPDTEKDFIIENPDGKKLYFKAIDWCVNVCRNGE
ncbi:MAG: hypothetical protein LAT76_08895, partial [Schleiferiaceae bacterium]|nr:hypothetical protein [Schleiferiaceae bacterium]